MRMSEEARVRHGLPEPRMAGPQTTAVPRQQAQQPKGSWQHCLAGNQGAAVPGALTSKPAARMNSA